MLSSLLCAAPSWTPAKITMESRLRHRRPGPYLRLCLCFMEQRELSVRQDSQTVGGTPRKGGVEDVGGWTRYDWTSAVSRMYLNMAQCPSSAVLNDKSLASPSSQTETPLQTPLYTHTQAHMHARTHTKTHTHKNTHLCTHKGADIHCIYAGKQAQNHAQRLAGILISCILHRWHFSLFKASFWGCGVHIERRHALSLNKVHLNYACSDYRHYILVCICICAHRSPFLFFVPSLKSWYIQNMCLQHLKQHICSINQECLQALSCRFALYVFVGL